MDEFDEENIMYRLMELDELIDGVSSMLLSCNMRGSRALDNIDGQLRDIINKMKKDLEEPCSEKKKNESE